MRNSVRSGIAQLSHFNANFIYHKKYSAKICNPGDIIDAEITNINKAGVLFKGEGDPAPVSILLEKQHHMNNEQFEKLRDLGYNIKVKI